MTSTDEMSSTAMTDSWVLGLATVALLSWFMPWFNGGWFAMSGYDIAAVWAHAATKQPSVGQVPVQAWVSSATVMLPAGAAAVLLLKESRHGRPQFPAIAAMLLGIAAGVATIAWDELENLGDADLGLALAALSSGGLAYRRLVRRGWTTAVAIGATLGVVAVGTSVVRNEIDRREAIMDLAEIFSLGEVVGGAENDEDDDVAVARAVPEDTEPQLEATTTTLEDLGSDVDLLEAELNDLRQEISQASGRRRYSEWKVLWSEWASDLDTLAFKAALISPTDSRRTRFASFATKAENLSDKYEEAALCAEEASESYACQEQMAEVQAGWSDLSGVAQTLRDP